MTGLLQFFDGRLKALCFGSDPVSRIPDDALIQAEPFGDGKSVGFARNPYQKAISRTQRFHIKLAGCVLNPGLICGINLQFRIMCRGGDHGSAFSRMFDDCDCQGRALRRISARSEFIEQHQRAILTGIQNLHNILHVCRKSGKILFDALFVTDVRENMGKDRQHTAV